MTKFKLNNDNLISSNNEWIIKLKPQDFIVNEANIISYSSSKESTLFIYFKLIKCGFTTFEVVKLLSDFFDIPAKNITYSGLKDEDGVTEQLVAIESNNDISKNLVENFNLKYSNNLNGNFINIIFQGKGNQPLIPGEIIGNGFRIIIRNLNYHVTNEIYQEKKLNFFFMNYYDTQRFGLAGKPHITHLIGKNLIDKNYEKAFALLKNSGNIRNQNQLTLSYQDFFKTLDPREENFYKNSYSSYLWNQQLFNLIETIEKDKIYYYKINDFNFCFTSCQEILYDILKNNSELPMKKYSLDNLKVVKKSLRPTVIQACVRIVDMEEDEYHQDMWKCTIEFFLPSGCYATMLIRQLLGYFFYKNYLT